MESAVKVEKYLLKSKSLLVDVGVHGSGINYALRDMFRKEVWAISITKDGGFWLMEPSDTREVAVSAYGEKVGRYVNAIERVFNSADRVNAFKSTIRAAILFTELLDKLEDRECAKPDMHVPNALRKERRQNREESLHFFVEEADRLEVIN
ncbi:MAG: hypothetical protein KGH49_01535 [Candidatus Micrarchaeota archaeon]|nr:hypothetical protein [Candidatus Micrarchaeota archaeon]